MGVGAPVGTTVGSHGCCATTVLPVRGSGPSLRSLHADGGHWGGCGGAQMAAVCWDCCGALQCQLFPVAHPAVQPGVGAPWLQCNPCLYAQPSWDKRPHAGLQPEPEFHGPGRGERREGFIHPSPYDSFQMWGCLGGSAQLRPGGSV